MRFIDILNNTNAKYLVNSPTEFQTEFGSSIGFGDEGEAQVTNDLELARKIIAEQRGEIFIAEKISEDGIPNAVIIFEKN